DADTPTLLMECLRQNRPTKAGITAGELRDWLRGNRYYGTVVGRHDDGSYRYEDRARIKGLMAAPEMTDGELTDTLKASIDDKDKESPILGYLVDDGTRQAISWAEMPEDLREPGDPSGAIVLHSDETLFGGFSSWEECEPWDAWKTLLELQADDGRIVAGDEPGGGDIDEVYAWLDTVRRIR
ncbi:MAG TPA: hypothetical protein VFI02_08740, partial [Armatimonadota bacterium]|nr:hypothetical protein [Armatimonadota bacterium]